MSACLKDLERRLAGRDVRIVRQIDRTAPPLIVKLEPLRQVIATLLAEAAAVTPDGGRIRVCLKHSSAAVMLSVKDGGPGMAAEARDALFRDASRAPAPGAPLPPARCLEVVRALDGNLFANSLPGKGSTYYLTLPPPEPV